MPTISRKNEAFDYINEFRKYDSEINGTGGNIGYSIRPTERKKGYNNINLYLGLKVCDSYGIKEVLMDADMANPASWKTMEAMGGVRTGQYSAEETVHCTVVDYKIDVKKALKDHRQYESSVLNVL